MIPLVFVASLLIFFYSVILHECAHGWVAYNLGDPTAKIRGRLSLNPLKHIDPMGTIVLPVMLTVMHSSVLFGWAKPVPVDFMNLRHPKRDMMWVGLAGPVTNIILAFIFSLVLRMHFSAVVDQIMTASIHINLILAIFNMTPVPPLDGSRLVMGILPNSYARAYARLEPYGLLVVFVLLWSGVLDSVLWPAVTFLANLLGAG